MTAELEFGSRAFDWALSVPDRINDGRPVWHNAWWSFGLHGVEMTQLHIVDKKKE
jgi:hypothetical protein